MDNSIIQRLLSQLTPDQVSQLMTETQAGQMNPRLLALMPAEQQRAFVESLRRPQFSFQPQLGYEDSFATYGGDVRADIPLGRNTTLGLTAGGMAGRGLGKAKDARMPFTPRGGIEFKHEF